MRTMNAIAMAMFLTAGCDRKQDAPQPTDPAPVAPMAADVGGNSSAPAPAEPQNMTFASAQDRLTQALRKYSAEQQRVPKSLNELVAAGYLSDIPKAPSGQTWTILPERVQVVPK